MPVNPGIQYQKAEREYHEANTVSEKIKALQEMLRTVPKHKSSENLVADIRAKLAKHKRLLEKEQAIKKGKAAKYSIKKEGAATVCIVGTTNSGKSTLLKKLTNANVEIADYEFTTKKPEIGVMNYKGIKIQVIEIPAIVENFDETKDGLAFLAIIRMADLIILMFKNNNERKLLEKELENIKVKKIIFSENIEDKIWNNLDLIKVYTKMPGKEKDWPPVALKKGSLVRDLARVVHKDFIDKFKFARIWGKSVKFDGVRVNLDYKLEDGDVVELHLR